MRDFLLSQSFYWDPVLLYLILLLAFWQICSMDMFRRNFLLQTGLLLFYMTAITAVAAFYMLEQSRDPRENLVIAGVAVFFFSSSLALLFAARGRVRDYGGIRAAFMYTLLASTAIAAFLFYASNGVMLPHIGIQLPFALTGFLLFLLCSGALFLEGILYDLLVFRNTNARVMCFYALSCVSGIFGYYVYMSRGLTRVFSL